MAPYPTKAEIQSMFEALATGDGPGFFAHVEERVDWQIQGHSPLSRVYDGKQDFFDGTIKLLNSRVLKEPLRMKTVNVVGGGDDAQAVVEMKADSVCKNGKFH